ncbi:chlorophyll a-b binding CP24 10A, chloroplastic [Olea europaea subsp. europaea]|uniref:Chlorophyll a-b binding CP24 10A, chloroplastic n=1 Tax=Olea europaea subsp. europaea TaxID=158383 RepID=A0A8S0TI26_OLEEU|nr:chlorophyll a-b binding CP24 10A, chloroplastic [Olea europaea subsp. europaea]
MAIKDILKVVNGLGCKFLTGGNKSQALLSASVTTRAVGAVPPKSFVVVAAAPKKSWIPAVKGGANFIDPEWLDGS